MVDIKKVVGKFFFRRLYDELEHEKQLCFRSSDEWSRKLTDADNHVNVRVAEVLMSMDPFEPLMQKFRGSFASLRERPEDGLDATSQLRMWMWGYQMMGDESFNYLMQWLLDREGNNFIRKGRATQEEILFSRAMLAAPQTVREQVKRLASRYVEYLERNKDQDFDPDMTVE